MHGNDILCMPCAISLAVYLKFMVDMEYGFTEVLAWGAELIPHDPRSKVFYLGVYYVRGSSQVYCTCIETMQCCVSSGGYSSCVI